jgi:hypothetical protein
METKYCYKCKQHKPITDFYKSTNGGCKKCIRAYQKRYYEEHYAPKKITDPEGFRTCSRCHQLKPLLSFYRDKLNVSGYAHQCKVCSDFLREVRRQKEKESKAALKERIPDGFKWCSGCKSLLPLTDFYQVKSGPRTGKPDSQCKGCRKKRKQTERYKESQRDYQKKDNVKARRSVTNKVWRKSSPERIAKEKAERTEYRKREYVKVKNKQRHTEYRSDPQNQEKARGRTIQWRKANPEKERHHALLKHYRKKNAEGAHTLEQWKTLLAFFDGKCPCCGKKRVLTRDHIIPLNKGGTNWITNIQPLCRSCNASKQDHHTTDYRPEAARLWATNC